MTTHVVMQPTCVLYMYIFDHCIFIVYEGNIMNMYSL